MEDDRMEGSVEQKKGKLKEHAGRALDDEKLKREGQGEQVSGKVKNVVGGMKDKLKEDDRH